MAVQKSASTDDNQIVYKQADGSYKAFVNIPEAAFIINRRLRKYPQDAMSSNCEGVFVFAETELKFVSAVLSKFTRQR